LIDACRVIAGTTPTEHKSLQEEGVCLGKIEALNWVAPMLYDENLRSCVPTDVTNVQMAKIIVAYLDQNADRLREPFDGLALEALAHAWRCPKNPGWFGKWLN
jgi:hypothetical protein